MPQGKFAQVWQERGSLGESSHNPKELVDTFRASSVFAPRMGNARGSPV
jgi:hypothetical protein